MLWQKNIFFSSCVIPRSMTVGVLNVGRLPCNNCTCYHSCYLTVMLEKTSCLSHGHVWGICGRWFLKRHVGQKLQNDWLNCWHVMQKDLLRNVKKCYALNFKINGNAPTDTPHRLVITPPSRWWFCPLRPCLCPCPHTRKVQVFVFAVN